MAAAQALADADFRVSVEPGLLRTSLTASRADALTDADVARIIHELVGIAATHGGRYDGFGGTIVPVDDGSWQATPQNGRASRSANDLWEFYEARSETGRASLSDQERGILAILDMRQEVSSGGFDSYFRYWGGDTAEEALRALPLFLGSEWENVLREAMGVLGDPYPSDIGAREVRLEEAGVEERLFVLDQRLSALGTTSDADARLTAALAAIRR